MEATRLLLLALACVAATNAVSGCSWTNMYNQVIDLSSFTLFNSSEYNFTDIYGQQFEFNVCGTAPNSACASNTSYACVSGEGVTTMSLGNYNDGLEIGQDMTSVFLHYANGSVCNGRNADVLIRFYCSESYGLVGGLDDNGESAVCTWTIDVYSNSSAICNVTDAQCGYTDSKGTYWDFYYFADDYGYNVSTPAGNVLINVCWPSTDYNTYPDALCGGASSACLNGTTSLGSGSGIWNATQSGQIYVEYPNPLAGPTCGSAIYFQCDPLADDANPVFYYVGNQGCRYLFGLNTTLACANSTSSTSGSNATTGAVNSTASATTNAAAGTTASSTTNAAASTTAQGSTTNAPASTTASAAVTTAEAEATTAEAESTTGESLTGEATTGESVNGTTTGMVTTAIPATTGPTGSHISAAPLVEAAGVMMMSVALFLFVLA